MFRLDEHGKILANPAEYANGIPTDAPRRMKTAWITGAGGLIGSHLAGRQPFSATWNVVGLTRADLDLCDAAAVTHRFRAESPACNSLRREFRSEEHTLNSSHRT